MEDKLKEDLKQAMKNNDVVRKNTIQLIRAALLSAAKESQNGLSQLQKEEIVIRQRKQRLDALSQFKSADRQDLVEQTKREIEVIENYLPEMLSEIAIFTEMKKLKSTYNFSTKKDLGNLIKKSKDRFGNRAEGRTISRIAQELLEGDN